ncbi:MAG: NAD(+) synthase [Candidatus Gracilibacteria bacterium]|jgi:NAD+ synthase
MHAIASTLIQEVHAFAKKSGFTKAVIGLSGGLDSTLALCIAIRAFGAKNVTAIIMPELGVSPYEETDHAKMIAEHFECTMHYEPINNFLVDYQFVAWEREPGALEHLKARLRAMLLLDYAECTGSMIIGTANKSDLQLGLGLKDGEFIGSLHILGDLYKTDLIELARHLNLPSELITAPFTRGLWPKQTDEDDLGSSWENIDGILRQMADKVDPDTMIEKGMDALLVHKIVRLTQENDSLAKSIPVLHIGRIPESIKKAQKAEAESML